MKRNSFLMAAIVLLYSCGNTSPNESNNKDTIAPQKATTPTPNNPGGLQTNGGTTSNGNNMGGTDTSRNRTNNSNRDSIR